MIVAHREREPAKEVVPHQLVRLERDLVIHRRQLLLALVENGRLRLAHAEENLHVFNETFAFSAEIHILPALEILAIKESSFAFFGRTFLAFRLGFLCRFRFRFR